MNIPHEVDIDGKLDYRYDGSNGRYIKYIGKATLQENGMFKVLADINGSLCVVEVKLTFPA
jgi:hypothetical protein